MMDGLGWIIAICTAGLVLLLALIIAPIMAGSYYTDRARCSSWGEATNRDTKFVHLTTVVVPLTWDCFTPDEGGKWIPTNRVRDID